MMWTRARVMMVASGAAVTGAVLFRWNRRLVDLEEFYRGKKVIVTGASRGIGKRLAVQLAQLGARQVIAARSIDQLNITAEECRQFSAEVHVVRADVGVEEDCKGVVEKAVEELGGVDILILNAGLSPDPQWFAAMDKLRETFLKALSVYLFQSVHLTKHCLPHLEKSRGVIVPVSSPAGKIGMPKVVPFSTSKHALNGFFKSLRQELILTNTSVDITVMPLPFVETDIAIQSWKPKGKLGRGISPDECAQKMLRGIPLRQAWYYIDWPCYIIGHLESLFPVTVENLVRFYAQMASENFS